MLMERLRQGRGSHMSSFVFPLAQFALVYSTMIKAAGWMRYVELPHCLHEAFSRAYVGSGAVVRAGGVYELGRLRIGPYPDVSWELSYILGAV